VNRIAVLLVHGVEIQDPEFAVAATELLKKRFSEHVGRRGPSADDALVIETVHWAPVLEVRQRELFGKMYGPGTEKFFEGVVRNVKELNRGSKLALPRFLASAAVQQVPFNGGGLHWPTARWVMTHFIGDAIAYPQTGDRSNYDAIHETYARALRVLATRAGPEAPLSVLSHSFGTIISSDHFYDLASPKKLVPAAVEAVSQGTPLERGETLCWFYTMGSPMALWSLRYPDAKLDRPIEVPSPKIANHHARHPALRGEWINFYDDDDIISYPLQPLSAEYQGRVADRRVALTVPGLSWSPAVHPFYWSDAVVMDPIAKSLAEGFRAIN
jgi:hypothetical protein